MSSLPSVLELAMRRYPEQRAMQIVFNALDAKGLARYADGFPRDLFYITDEDVITALMDYIKA